MWIETSCIGEPIARDARTPILPMEHRRELTNTFLAYPEWSIVYAYDDLAAVSRARGESAYAYASAIIGYWRNLCAVTAHASAVGDLTLDMKAMLYVIGLSFAAEMAAKGAYESSFGALSEAMRGPQPTPEDLFAWRVADDYAAFLRQTPWYEYPFGSELMRFWRETPWTTVSIARSLERRLALTTEYGAKAVYARALGALAGVAPAMLEIHSVVTGLREEERKPAGMVTVIERRADGSLVVETPRYKAFADFLVRHVQGGGAFVEIAGNVEIFATALFPASAADPEAAGPILIRAPLQRRDGWVRRGYPVRLAELDVFLRSLADVGGEFEHVYDY